MRPPMHSPDSRTTATWPLVWIYALLIVYASLYPFDDWRNQDLAPWSFVGAPWPRYNTAFDIWSNLLGYMPLGFWLSLAALRTGSHWGTSAASTVIETACIRCMALTAYCMGLPA